MNGGKHGEMLYGMSSVKEYWKRARSNAQPDFETTSSDCSFDESNSSSSKEYRDASCNVDFDDDTDVLVEETIPDVTNKSTKNLPESTVLTIDKNTHIKSSRYVRWNVLMGLGIGLWLVLCIVDLLHSEKSVTREWLFVYILGKRIAPKIEPPKKLETPVFWYPSIWPYLWKFMTLTTSGGAYVLLFLLMVIFCADPRLRNGSASSSAINGTVPKTLIPKTISNSIVAKKPLVLQKMIPSRCFNDRRVPRILSIRLELAPTLNLQRKFLSSLEKCVQADVVKFHSSTTSNSPRSKETRVAKISRDSNDRENESATCFSIDRELVELLDARNNEESQFSGIDKIDIPSIGKIDVSVKDTVSLCLMETRRSDLNFNASTFDLEIGEYLKRTRRPSRNVFPENSFQNNYENGRNVIIVRPEVSNRGETVKTRIITSSPAFKKFLSSFQQNSRVS